MAPSLLTLSVLKSRTIDTMPRGATLINTMLTKSMERRLQVTFLRWVNHSRRQLYDEELQA